MGLLIAGHLLFADIAELHGVSMAAKIVDSVQVEVAHADGGGDAHVKLLKVVVL